MEFPQGFLYLGVVYIQGNTRENNDTRSTNYDERSINLKNGKAKKIAVFRQQNDANTTDLVLVSGIEWNFTEFSVPSTIVGNITNRKFNTLQKCRL